MKRKLIEQIARKQVQLDKLAEHVDKSFICSQLYNKVVIEKAILKKQLDDLKKNAENKQFYETALDESGLYLEWASDEIKNDKTLVMKAVAQNPGALEFASDRLKADKDVLMQSVETVGWTVCYASDELRADKDVILKAVKNDGQALYYASKELRDDKEVVLEAVKNKGIIIKYASLDARSDIDIAKAALLQNKKTMDYVKGCLNPEIIQNEDIQAIINPSAE
mgnify:CR=1 FL=1